VQPDKCLPFVSEERAIYNLRVVDIYFYPNDGGKVQRSLENSANFYQNTLSHIQKDSSVHSHRHLNLKSQTYNMIS